MGDEWDDDDWDVDDNALDALDGPSASVTPVFEEEEDLAVTEKEKQAKINAVELKKKGNARLEKEEAAKQKALEEKAAKMSLQVREQRNKSKATRSEATGFIDRRFAHHGLCCSKTNIKCSWIQSERLI